jgi:6-phosphofructokinase 1
LFSGTCKNSTNGNNIEVFGIKYRYKGLIKEELIKLDSLDVDGIAANATFNR